MKESPEYFYCLLIRGKLTQEEKKHVSEIYRKLGKEEITRIVNKKKIIPFAARTFCECGLDSEEWDKIFQDHIRRNRNILSFLDTAYKALHEHGVKRMFVSENFGALLSADENIGLFTSGDIDNFAPISEREKIYAAMEAIGCTRKERYACANQIAAEFFPPEKFNLPEKFYLSVDFYPLARLKLPCFIDEKNFVDWDKLHYYPGTEIALAPADALMYICMLHISLHSFSRAPDIRLYIDLLNMSKVPIHYDLLAKWCKRDQTCTRAAVAAEISNRLMQTNIPKEITMLSTKKERLLRRVYSEDKRDLIYEPKGLKILVIETLCNDRGISHGILNILHPDKEWMKKTYGSCGVRAKIKHILRTL